MGQIYQSFPCNAFKLKKSFPMQRSHEMFACIFPVQNFLIFNSLIYVTFIFLWGVRSEAKLVSFYECLISCPHCLILLFSPTDDHLLYHEVAHTLGLFQAGSLSASHKKKNHQFFTGGLAQRLQLREDDLLHWSSEHHPAHHPWGFPLSSSCHNTPALTGLC